MISLWRQSIYCYRALCTWLNPVAFISNILVRPVMTILMFALVGRYARSAEEAQAYVVGLTAYGATNILAGGIAQCFSNERREGALPYLLTATGGRFRAYFSRALPHYPNAFLCFASGMAAGALLLGADYRTLDWPATLLAFALIAASMSTFSLFLGALSIAFTDFWIFSSTAETVLLVLTGVIIPLAALPAWLGAVGRALPITNGLEALRLTYEGAGIAAVAPLLVAEAAVAVGFAALGYGAFRAVEVYARRTGTFDHV
jgi:ABC-2 type transport system permease protein